METICSAKSLVVQRTAGNTRARQSAKSSPFRAPTQKTRAECHLSPSSSAPQHLPARIRTGLTQDTLKTSVQCEARPAGSTREEGERSTALKLGAAVLCGALALHGLPAVAAVAPEIDTSALEVLDNISPTQASSLISVLRPVLSLTQLLFIARIVMTWDPNIKDTELPWAIAYYPTEPVLGPTRKLIQPVGGVDVSPIVIFAFLSLSNEILLGPQGLLVLLSNKMM